MVELDENTRRNFTSKHYRLVGRHSAVEICSWTKKSITDEGVCYKEKFYGVHSHRCAQVAPMVAWCEQNCMHCWRPMEMFRPPTNINGEVDEPDVIINGMIEQRKKLLLGFGGNAKSNREKYGESLEPDHWAISLSGEATLYPRLPELIRRITALKNTKTVFLVTNGQEPEMLQRLADENALPTQLYVSLIAPNEMLYKRLALPFYKDGWERLMRTLMIWRTFETRKVIRITQIKGMNDNEESARQFAGIISHAQPDFVEIKAYMFLGYSRKRLMKENMPSMKDVEGFAGRILQHLSGYSTVDKDRASLIVLLRNDTTKFPTRIL